MRKIKKKLPPLSGRDSFLYAVLIVGCFVVTFLGAFLLDYFVSALPSATRT